MFVVRDSVTKKHYSAILDKDMTAVMADMLKQAGYLIEIVEVVSV